MKYQKANQVHNPPRCKKSDAEVQPLKRIWLKDGKTTMPFVEGLTENACAALINSINSTLIKLGKKPLPKNKFLITR